MAWKSRAKIGKDIETLEGCCTNKHDPITFQSTFMEMGLGLKRIPESVMLTKHGNSICCQQVSRLHPDPSYCFISHEFSSYVSISFHIHMFTLVVACCTSHFQLSAPVSSAIPIPKNPSPISVSHILGGAFLQAMEDVAPPEEFVDQESLRAVLGESHEDHQVGMAKLAEHAHLFLQWDGMIG